VNQLELNQINNLPGMIDNWGDSAIQTYKVRNDLHEIFSQHGYELIETPILEESELFIRKSGAELSTKLFSFIDQYGNKICLRPEITPSIIRHYIQNDQNKDLPWKIQYHGPIFRHDTKLRQSTQFGLEVIGGSGIEFESELIYLSFEGMKKLGVKNTFIKLGNVGLIKEILSNFNLSNTLKLFAINNISELINSTISVTALVNQAQQLGLLDDLNSTDTNHIKDPEVFLSKFSDENSQNYLGRRTAKEMLQRLELKSERGNDKNNFISALNLLVEIISIETKDMKQLESIQKIINSANIPTNTINDTKLLIQNIYNHGISENSIQIDFSLARGISYYTGIVFDIYQTVGAKPLVIGGGGRYDSLVKAFGGKDVPAIGFAYNLDSINNI
jgi:histidyl-tRNA synthetase